MAEYRIDGIQIVNQSRNTFNSLSSYYEKTAHVQKIHSKMLTFYEK